MEHGNQGGEGRGGEWSTGIRVEQRGEEGRGVEHGDGSQKPSVRHSCVSNACRPRVCKLARCHTHTHLFTHRLCPASSFDHKSPLPLLTARSPSHTALLTCPPLALPPLTAASHPSHRWLVQLLSRPRAKFDEVSEQKKKRGS